MQLIMRAILVALFVPLAVVAQDAAETDGQPLDDVQELSPEELEAFLQELQEQGSAKLAQEPKPDQETHDYSGEWIEEDGVRYCDGYLTRNADEEYCSTDVPEDWRAFEFDGETYFVAPLREEQE